MQKDTMDIAQAVERLSGFILKAQLEGSAISAIRM
jgi:hypothetical protein